MRKKRKRQTKPQDSEFFDDCPVCQAMKKAEVEGKELNIFELKEAFEEAKKNDAIVGEFQEPTNKRAD